MPICPSQTINRGSSKVLRQQKNEVGEIASKFQELFKPHLRYSNPSLKILQIQIQRFLKNKSLKVWSLWRTNLKSFKIQAWNAFDMRLSIQALISELFIFVRMTR